MIVDTSCLQSLRVTIDVRPLGRPSTSTGYNLQPNYRLRVKDFVQSLANHAVM